MENERAARRPLPDAFTHLLTEPPLTVAGRARGRVPHGRLPARARPLLLLAGAGRDGRVQAVDVAFRVLEHRPTSPRLGPRTFRNLDVDLLEVLGGLVDVVDLEDDAAEAADLLGLIGKAQRQGERGLRALG